MEHIATDVSKLSHAVFGSVSENGEIKDGVAQDVRAMRENAERSNRALLVIAVLVFLSTGANLSHIDIPALVKLLGW